MANQIQHWWKQKRLKLRLKDAQGNFFQKIRFIRYNRSIFTNIILRSSRSVEPEFSETPEIEIPNDVAELMDDFEPEKLEMCYGTECINLDNSDIKIRPAQSDCTVKYEQWETCAAVTKTHNTDKIMQGEYKLFRQGFLREK